MTTTAPVVTDAEWLARVLRRGRAADRRAGFRDGPQARPIAQCADTDAGHPDNADLVIDDAGNLMRVVLSIQKGEISSATLLRRLSTYSRRNNFSMAFRDVGRVIRTVQLLRFLSDAPLRRRTTAETN